MIPTVDKYSRELFARSKHVNYVPIKHKKCRQTAGNSNFALFQIVYFFNAYAAQVFI
jgi:hypothetical protein